MARPLDPAGLERLRAGRLGRHVVLGAANDARPFFAHQDNLAEDGTFFPVADALLAQYRSWYSVPLVQPTMTQAGLALAHAQAWAAAVQSGKVSGYVEGGSIHLQAPKGLSVPVSGSSSVGSRYDGVVDSGWVAMPSSGRLVLQVS